MRTEMSFVPNLLCGQIFVFFSFCFVFSLFSILGIIQVVSQPLLNMATSMVFLRVVRLSMIIDTSDDSSNFTLAIGEISLFIVSPNCMSKTIVRAINFFPIHIFGLFRGRSFGIVLSSFLLFGIMSFYSII